MRHLYSCVLLVFFSSVILGVSLNGQTVLLEECQTQNDATPGIDRKNWNSGITDFHSDGYANDFLIPSNTLDACTKVVQINITIDILAIDASLVSPSCVSDGGTFVNVYVGCGQYSGPASCSPDFIIDEFNNPDGPLSLTLAYDCFNFPSEASPIFDKWLSVDIIDLYCPLVNCGGTSPEWNSLIQDGDLLFDYETCVQVIIDDESCDSSGCTTPTTMMLPCDDNLVCTDNDMMEVLTCDNTIICTPCAGEMIDCSTGPSSQQPCDDSNPNTINDIETVLDCDGSICIPCAGEIFFDCPVLMINIGDPCDDQDPDTVDDVIQSDCACAGAVIPCVEVQVCNTDCTLGDIQEWNPALCLCETIEDFSLGCTDPLADNYDANADCDDGTCVTSPDLFLPNVLSLQAEFPNNGIVLATNSAATNINIQIYDRWGTLVLSRIIGSLSSDVTVWDGTLGGRQHEQGVYVYVMTYDHNGQAKQQAGDITLLN